MPPDVIAHIVATSAVSEGARAADVLRMDEERRKEAQKIIRRLTTQAPFFQSKRVGSAALSLLTAVLVDPSVQAALLPLLGTVIPPAYLPLGTSVLAAFLALLSKKGDLRQVREAGPFQEGQ